MHFLMTNDVECFSIPLNKLDTGTVKEVYEVGLLRLLDLYARHKMHILFQPNECLDVGDRIEATRRKNNLIEILTSASEYGFELVSASEYRKMIRS